MGLAGSRVGAADAILCGLADVFVRSDVLPLLTLELEACKDTNAMEQCLGDQTVQPPPGMTDERRAWIDECFSLPTVEEITAALLGHLDIEARACAEELRKMSPISLKLTFKAIRNARAANNLAAALKQEFCLVQACGRWHDMIEGIRAAIVDKDRNPRWSPARLEDVPSKLVEAHFDDPASEALELELG